MAEYIYTELDELFDEECGDMTIDEQKELLEYIKVNLPTIDMVQYVETWMEMIKENENEY